MNHVEGYKAFNKNRTNRYGVLFEENKWYHVDAPVSFGNNGNGFHMCTSLCDVFRYVDAGNVVVAKVIGSGDFKSYDDEYYGYYDMYVVEDLFVKRFLSREEIIGRMLVANSFSVEKFLQTCVLSDEEKRLFLEKFRDNVSILKKIYYYQYGCKSVYDNENDVKWLGKVKRYGSNCG